jgi:hypothetical protein
MCADFLVCLESSIIYVSVTIRQAAWGGGRREYYTHLRFVSLRFNPGFERFAGGGRACRLYLQMISSPCHMLNVGMID